MMRVAPLFFFACLSLTGCTLKTKSACPENPSPDDPSCTPVDCEDDPNDVRCTASTRDGGDSPKPAAACVESAQCKDRTSARCDHGSCTKCVDDADCGRFTDTPICSPNGICVPCVDGQVELCRKQQRVCQIEAMQCVECNAFTDCKNDKLPICDGNVCRGCKADVDCAPEGKLCREETGECVECIPNADGPELEGCKNGKACDPATFTCVGRPSQSVGTCGKTNDGVSRCVSDSECAAGHRCVPISFPAGKSYGSYCLESATSTGCSWRTPLSRMGVSILGVAGMFCFPTDVATCEAVWSFRAACTVDEDCGATDLADGRCERGSCTYECVNDRDCFRSCLRNRPGAASYCDPG